MRKIRNDIIDRSGEKNISNEGYEIEIIEYFNCENITIRFKSGVIVKNKTYRRFKSGSILNPYHPSTHGIGYFGEGFYKAKLNKIFTKQYTTWFSMFNRCSNSRIKNNPTYKDVTVCKEWHNFQNFAKWFDENSIESFHLDKDILFKGNKTYSPETCCFVPQEVNTLFTKRKKSRGSTPIGVSRSKGKYSAQVNIGKGLLKHLGYFTIEIEAFQAYKIAKEEYIKEVANRWKDQITEQTYQALINYKVEITD